MIVKVALTKSMDWRSWTQLDEDSEELESYGLQTGPLTVRVSEVGEEDWATAAWAYCFPVARATLLNSCSLVG